MAGEAIQAIQVVTADRAMLAPAAALVLWSLAVLAWLVVVRGGAFKQAGISLAKAPPGGRGTALEGVLPDRANWPGHNYSHLMEQPTLFYPAVLILALTGATRLDVTLAWAYVALRIAHSLWQGLVNTLPIRFALFAAATLCLAVLAVRALLAVI